MKKLIFSLLIICLNISAIFGQNIKGIIVAQEDSQPLAYASVKILTADTVVYTAYTTNDKGQFEKTIPLDNFRLHISYMGYKDIDLSIKNSDRKDIDLGTITMYGDSSTMLNEAIVTAQSVIQDGNKMIVIPSSQQMKASTSGIDLLQKMQLPGMFVDPINQKVSIEGTSGVIYRINGINSTLEQVVALKAERILRIEYNQTPSARELDSNSGVINVILKQETTGSYLYTYMLGAFSTGFVNGNANARTIFSKSELSLDYNVNWRDCNQRQAKVYETYNSPDDTISFYQKGSDAPFGYLTQNINLSYTYNGAKNIFVAKFLNSLSSSFDWTYFDIFQNQSNNPLFFRNIHSQSKSYTPSLDLYYIHKFEEKKGIEVNMVGTLINSDYNRELADTHTNYESYIINAANGNKKSLLLESFYYNKKGKINYNLGLKAGYSHTENAYNIADKSKIKLFNLYPYISLDGKIGDIFYSLGTGVQVLHTDDDNLSKNYYRNLSTLSLLYNNNSSWNVRNIIRYTPSMPSLSSLNDIDQRVDSLMTIRGNSALKPSQTLSDRFTFTYQIKKNIRTTLDLNASKTFDPIGNSYYYDPNTKSFVNQIDNQKHERGIGAGVSLYWSSIFDIFSIWTGAIYDNYRSEGVNYSHNLDNFYWYISCSAQVKDFSFYANYYQPSKSLYGQTEYLNENYSSIGASYKKKNLTVQAGIMLPLTDGNRYGAYLRSSSVCSNTETYIRDSANMFFIGFSYNISSGKSIFKIDKNLNNADSDNGIMKL